MADIPVILTCADYARVMPLVTGDVKPEGIALTVIHGTGGSWEMRAEMLRRALDDPTVQGGEASMAGHLRRIDKGDRSHVGLPVFPLRNFTARDLYVRKGGPVKSPADLIGKRIGMYDWVARARSGTGTFCALSGCRRKASNGGSATSIRHGRPPISTRCPRGCAGRRRGTLSRTC